MYWHHCHRYTVLQNLQRLNNVQSIMHFHYHMTWYTFIPCAHLRNSICLKPNTQSWTDWRWCWSHLELISPIPLCFKFSVFQLACRRQLARNMYSIQYSTYQIQILSPSIQLCLTLLKRTLTPHSCIITHYYQIQSCCLYFYMLSEWWEGVYFLGQEFTTESTFLRTSVCTKWLLMCYQKICTFLLTEMTRHFYYPAPLFPAQLKKWKLQ